MPNQVDPGASIVQNTGLATPAADEFLDELASGLPARIRHRIAPFDRVDSTNRIARDLALLPNLDTDIVVADLQSAGRGRLGRGWYSERGHSIVSSFIVRLSGEASGWALLPIAAAVATAEAVESAISPTRVRIKWPNDLVVGGGKLSGILIESVRPGLFVVGIGINVGRMLFPNDIAHRAVSIAAIAGSEHVGVSRMRVLSSLVQRMDERCAAPGSGEGRRTLLGEYRDRLLGVGAEVELKRTADSTVIRGRLEGIEDDGALVLRTEAGRETFHAGEITSGVLA